MSANIAKTDDGTVQITFTITWKEVKKAQEKVADQIAGEIEIPGFRKGKAPLAEVIKHTPQNTLIEKTLQELLPRRISAAFKENKIVPAIYPKIEIIKTQEGEDWQIRAITCELPDIKLGDYKKAVRGSLAAKSIWTPEKGKPDEEKKESSIAEKQQEAIETLLKHIKVKIPKLLIDTEVNSRLSSLLNRLEKLGVSLESYLSSLGKTAESLRNEYKKAAESTIKLDLILGKIAEKENIKVTDNEFKKEEGAKDAKTPEQVALLRSLLTKRKVIESLVPS